MSRASYLRRPLTALLVAAALAASVVIAAVVLASPPAQAATTFTVTTSADEQNTNDLCSLREAIINANQNNQSGSADCPAGDGEDTINFNLVSPATITLGSQLTIADSAGLVIDGGSANITVSGSNAVRVFDFLFDADAKLTLNNITVANGRAVGAVGGGIANNGGTLTVNNSTLSGNSATAPLGNGGGGGIWNAGTLTVNNSTLSGNSADIGGGIYNQGGTLTVSNSTLSGNSANNGGGLGMNAGSVTLKNTIVANSPSGDNCSGTITNGGYNLDSDGSCGFGTANHSLSGTTDNPLDPQLGSLANNGGPTLTHALLAGSPAIDKGSSFSATIDQRGLPRPSNFVGIVNADDGSDIGAFERQAPPDTKAPKVTNKTTVPAAGATQVAPWVNVKATFTEAMDASPTATDGDPSTINGTTFTLFKQGSTTKVAAAVSYDATTNKATLNPNANLQRGTKYKAVVTTGAQDLAGNQLDQNSNLDGLQQKTWTFTIRN